MTALEAIKTIENRAALLLFMEDIQAKKVLVAWTLYQPKCQDRALKRGENLESAFASLWDVLWPTLSFERLADLSDVPLRTTVKLFERLRDARMVFPDGTIAKIAHNLIVSEVGSYVENITPEAWRKKPATTVSSAPSATFGQTPKTS